MIRIFFFYFVLLTLLSGCGTTAPSTSLKEAVSMAVVTSSNDAVKSSRPDSNTIESGASVRDFKFPLTISCLLKSKSDPTVAVVGIFIVEENRATETGANFFKYERIAKGIYKSEALFSTSTLDINSMSISATGAASKVYGDCYPLN